MDPFVLIILGGIAGLVIALLLLGRFYPGSGAEQLDWRPTRSVELEVQNELDDLDQMREALNARRRSRGQEELTEEGVRASVQDDERLRNELRERAREGQDVTEMLEAKNARRLRKGLPEVTEAEYRAQIERESGGTGPA